MEEWIATPAGKGVLAKFELGYNKDKPVFIVFEASSRVDFLWPASKKEDNYEAFQKWTEKMASEAPEGLKTLRQTS